LIFLVSLLLYGYTQAQGVGFGDELRFLIRIEEGFDWSTNATNHFFYTNLLVALSKMFSLVEVFKLAVWFSSIFGALTVAMVAFIVNSLFNSRKLALLCALILMLSFTFWRQSVTIEVYTFNLFILSVYLFFAYQSFNEKSAINILLASTLLGISMWVHIQNILLIPSLLYIVYNRRKFVVGIVPIVAILGFMIVYTLIIDGTSGFFLMIYGNVEYLEKATGFQLLSIIKGLLKGDFYFLFNFGLMSVIIFVGIYKLFIANKDLFYFNGLFTIPTWLFSCNYDVPDHYVFFLPSYLALVLVIPWGFNYLVEIISNRRVKFVYASVFFPLIIYSVTPFIILQFERGQQIHNSKLYKGGLYYLTQPWMHQNPTLLPLVKEYKLKNKLPEFYDDMKWTYDIANDYLEEKKGD
jgi:hypothetical protein